MLHLRRLMLLLRLGHLALRLLLGRLMLLLQLGRLMLLLLGNLIVRLHRCRDFYVAIGRERLVDGQTGWAAMVDAGKLSPVCAGNMFILKLRSHGWSVLFMASRQFRGSGTDLQAARSAVETHACAATVFAHGAVVDVVHN